MNEVEIAHSVLETILAEAEKLKLEPVAATLSCGSVSAADREAVLEAFEMASRDTICRRTSLCIREIPVRIRCNACSATTDYSLASPRCSACSSEDFTFLPEPPVTLEEIEFKEA